MLNLIKSKVLMSRRGKSRQYSQIFTQIFTVIYRNFSLWTVFQFQQLIIYKLVQFLQLVSFLSCCSAHIPFASARSVSCCDFSACSEKSFPAVDSASASFCSAFLFAFSSLTSSLRAFLFWPAATFDLLFFCSSK